MNKHDLRTKAESLRKELNEDFTSPIDIFSLAFSIPRLSIVIYPMGKQISGMCVKGNHNNTIAINSSMTLGRQRFSLAHELYHLYFEDTTQTTICSRTIGSGKEIEKNADQFASFFLIPPVSLHSLVEQLKNLAKNRISVNDIVRIEQYFGVSRQAILYRLVNENIISHNEAETMKTNIIQTAKFLGFNDELYRPRPETKKYGTYGFYIQQAKKALEKGLITNGKYEELLLEAFRPDLVFGDEYEVEEFFD